MSWTMRQTIAWRRKFRALLAVVREPGVLMQPTLQLAYLLCALHVFVLRARARGLVYPVHAGSHLRRREMPRHLELTCPCASTISCRFGCRVLVSLRTAHEDEHLLKPGVCGAGMMDTTKTSGTVGVGSAGAAHA